MKIKILSLILCLTFLLTLASCAFERHDLLHSIEIDGVTYCVRGSGTRAKQLVVKRGDDVLWARGLPGKDAPESSGKLIARTILRLCGGKEHGA